MSVKQTLKLGEPELKNNFVKKINLWYTKGVVFQKALKKKEFEMTNKEILARLTALQEEIKRELEAWRIVEQIHKLEIIGESAFEAKDEEK